MKIRPRLCFFRVGSGWRRVKVVNRFLSFYLIICRRGRDTIWVHQHRFMVFDAIGEGQLGGHATLQLSIRGEGMKACKSRAAAGT